MATKFDIFGLEIEVHHDEGITAELKNGAEILEVPGIDSEVLLLDGKTIAAMFAEVMKKVIATPGRNVVTYVKEVAVSPLSGKRIPIGDSKLNITKIGIYKTRRGAYIVNFT